MRALARQLSNSLSPLRTHAYAHAHNRLEQKILPSRLHPEPVNRIAKRLCHTAKKSKNLHKLVAAVNNQTMPRLTVDHHCATLSKSPKWSRRCTCAHDATPPRSSTRNTIHRPPAPSAHGDMGQSVTDQLNRYVNKSLGPLNESQPKRHQATCHCKDLSVTMTELCEQFHISQTS